MKQTKLRELTEEEVSEWKSSEVTKRLYALLEVEIEVASNTLLNLSGTAQERGERHIQYRGMIKSCENILDLNAGDLNSLIEEDEDEA